MKNLQVSTLMGCLLLLAIAVQGQTNNLLAGKWKTNWAKVADDKWMLRTEVSNGIYRLFLDDLKQQGNTEAYKQFYPDTTRWATPEGTTNPLQVFYFSNAAYNNYPVVNITYEAATAFCNWLTQKYSAIDKQSFGRVVFRLPNREEWMSAARGTTKDNRTYPWGSNFLRNNRGVYLCNFAHADSIMPQAAYITAPVNSFYPNLLGLYNVCGNVAEMLSEKGQAAGGSYLSGGYDVRIESIKNYKAAAPDIGFRVIMVKIAAEMAQAGPY